MSHEVPSLDGAPASKILYLCENAGRAAQVRLRLEQDGWLVELKSDAVEGLALALAGGHALLLVDQDLSGLNGLEVLQLLPRMEAPPTVLIGAPGSEVLEGAALKLGAARFLVREAEHDFADQVAELLPCLVSPSFRHALVEDGPAADAAQVESCRKLVELCPEGIALHDAGRFQFVNPAGARILGAASPESLVGRRVLDHVHPDYHQVYADRLRLLVERDVEIPWLEEKLLRQDGEPVDVEVTVLPFERQGRVLFQTTFRDIGVRKAAQSRQERLTCYDALTGLCAGPLFLDRLGQAVLQARREEGRFAVLALELHRFPELNQRIGSYFGDQVLKEAGQRLSRCLNETDSATRAGADRFLLLVRGAGRAEVADLCQRILEQLGRPFELNGETCSLAANIGISLNPEDGVSTEQHLAQAEGALQRSRETGPNRFQFLKEAVPVAPQARLTRSGTVTSPLVSAGEEAALVS